MESPKLVASSSLDEKIRLWDFSIRESPVLTTELKDPCPNSHGVRGITYSSNYGSNLLSYGFANHISIWSPEVSITRAFIGRLEGHNNLIVLCKFIANSPELISVDDKCNIRIWDIRSMSTIQALSMDNYTLMTDLCLVTGKHDKFVLSGKRLTYYENEASSKTTKKFKNIHEDVSALFVDFNVYFN